MPDNETPKDKWDKADVIGKLLIPVVLAAATLWFDSSRKQSDAKQKTFEVATEILKAPQSKETTQLRAWALEVFTNETGVASADLPKGAVQELQQGTQLPTSQLQMPNPAQLFVSIIRLEGTSPEQSERLKSALVAAGYANVTMSVRSKDAFPSQGEVRFYYPADSQNAQSLSAYMSNVLHIPVQSNDRSQDPDATSHRLGSLHVYIR